MSGWFDRWAKESARTGSLVRGAEATRAQTEPQTTTDGMTRRDALRRAGVIGAVVWTAPVIQSVTAPAFALTLGDPVCGNTSTTNCGDPDDNCDGECANGEPCRGDADCQGTCNSLGLCESSQAGEHCTQNSACTSGSCDQSTQTCNYIATGSPCTQGGDCRSGDCAGTPAVCQKGYADAVCGGPGDCYSNECRVDGTCARSDAGEPCRNDADCRDPNNNFRNGCNNNTVTGAPGTCQGPNKRRRGQSCTQNSQCASNICAVTCQ